MADKLTEKGTAEATVDTPASTSYSAGKEGRESVEYMKIKVNVQGWAYRTTNAAVFSQTAMGLLKRLRKGDVFRCEYTKSDVQKPDGSGSYTNYVIQKVLAVNGEAVGEGDATPPDDREAAPRTAGNGKAQKDRQDAASAPPQDRAQAPKAPPRSGEGQEKPAAPPPPPQAAAPVAPGAMPTLAQLIDIAALVWREGVGVVGSFPGTTWADLAEGETSPTPEEVLASKAALLDTWTQNGVKSIVEAVRAVWKAKE